MGESVSWLYFLVAPWRTQRYKKRMAYVSVMILLAVALLIGSGILILSYLLGPRLPNPRKNNPFECGVPPQGSAHQRFSVRFYLVAILFLLFDLEGIFFFPWALVYKKYLSMNAFILIEMAIFFSILLVGYLYVLKKGALEWESDYE